MYVDYSFYNATYGGTVLESDFTKLNNQAQSKVDYFTFGRISKLLSLPKSVQFAVCEIIDYLNQQGKYNSSTSVNDRRIASETIGSHSVSYKYGDEINKAKSLTEQDHNKNIYEICATYLMNEQNLMYRGVDSYDYGIEYYSI